MEEYVKLYTNVPADIYKTKKLTSGEKLIAERITALCMKNGYAWVTNKKLADIYGIREDTVSKYIKSLIDYGYIKCVYRKDINNKSKRAIYLTNNVWDNCPTIDSLNKQEKIGHISKHNNNYNKKINDIFNKQKYYIDENGIEYWDGKPCVSTPATLKEQKEMEELIHSIVGDSYE